MKETNRNYLVFHGHFYQPPREDPWTGTIPRQPSASPYDNWNVRINRECYAANSASRILNSAGNIVKIENNYRYFSFNFGPTLMGWLKNEAPHVYERIIEADRESVKLNGGHGNAIAQSYNHTILPLDPPDMVKTQIYWGIEDFRSHFGRQPEGIWLPETAVNNSVIDELISQNIKFIILSPWQAEAVCPEGGKNWRSLYDHPIPSHKAYKIERSKGRLNIFFYDPTLASGISFSHYLTDADKLKTTLEGYYNENDPSHLVNIATDGEIYGHHEPFGDMCFAALAGKISDKFLLTNYAHYLELNPPTENVKLRSGEDGAGTSWSCSHGVSRWYKNCGCHTGGEKGWNQEWRTPLRNGFNYLRNAASKVFTAELAKSGISDPYALRNKYISVLTGETDKNAFFGEYFPGAADRDRQNLIRLFEGQKYMMYMFTSCGWFFNEISGIEPVQNMKYALRLIELYKPWFTGNALEKLLVDLSEAKSNIPGKGTGRNIMETDVLPESRGDSFGTAVLIFRQLLQPYKKPSFGFYKMKEIGNASFEDITSYSSACISQNSETDISTKWKFDIFTSPDEGILIRLESDEKKETVAAAALPAAIRAEISREYRKNLEQQCFDQYSILFEKVKSSLNIAKQLGTPPSDMVRKTAEVIVSQLLYRKLHDETTVLSDEEIEQLKSMLVFKNTHNLEINEQGISRGLSRMLAFQTDSFSENLSTEITAYIQKLVRLADLGKLKIEKTIPQNTVYEMIHKNKETYFEEIENQNFEAFRHMKMLISLGELLGIEVGELKQRLLSF